MAKNYIDLGQKAGREGREDFQSGWQNWVGNRYFSKRILDVGAGLGKSRFRLQRNGNVAHLQDIAPKMPVDITVPIDIIPPESYDVVTAFDVIEHIEQDVNFLAEMVRISREAVIITTPNFNVSQNKNPYHVREYTPFALTKLLDFYNVELYIAGDGNGWKVREYPKVEDFLSHTLPHHGFVLKKVKNAND